MTDEKLDAFIGDALVKEKSSKTAAKAKLSKMTLPQKIAFFKNQLIKDNVTWEDVEALWDSTNKDLAHAADYGLRPIDGGERAAVRVWEKAVKDHETALRGEWLENLAFPYIEVDGAGKVVGHSVDELKPSNPSHRVYDRKDLSMEVAEEKDGALSLLRVTAGGAEITKISEAAGRKTKTIPMSQVKVMVTTPEKRIKSYMSSQDAAKAAAQSGLLGPLDQTVAKFGDLDQLTREAAVKTYSDEADPAPCKWYLVYNLYNPETKQVEKHRRPLYRSLREDRTFSLAERPLKMVDHEGNDVLLGAEATMEARDLAIRNQGRKIKILAGRTGVAGVGAMAEVFNSVHPTDWTTGPNPIKSGIGGLIPYFAQMIQAGRGYLLEKNLVVASPGPMANKALGAAVRSFAGAGSFEDPIEFPTEPDIRDLRVYRALPATGASLFALDFTMVAFSAWDWIQAKRGKPTQVPTLFVWKDKYGVDHLLEFGDPAVKELVRTTEEGWHAQTAMADSGPKGGVLVETTVFFRDAKGRVYPRTFVKAKTGARDVEDYIRRVPADEEDPTRPLDPDMTYIRDVPETERSAKADEWRKRLNAPAGEEVVGAEEFVAVKPGSDRARVKGVERAKLGIKAARVQSVAAVASGKSRLDSGGVIDMWFDEHGSPKLTEAKIGEDWKSVKPETKTPVIQNGREAEDEYRVRMEKVVLSYTELPTGKGPIAWEDIIEGGRTVGRRALAGKEVVLTIKKSKRGTIDIWGPKGHLRVNLYKDLYLFFEPVKGAKNKERVVRQVSVLSGVDEAILNNKRAIELGGIATIQNPWTHTMESAVVPVDTAMHHRYRPRMEETKVLLARAKQGKLRIEFRAGDGWKKASPAEFEASKKAGGKYHDLQNARSPRTI